MTRCQYLCDEFRRLRKSETRARAQKRERELGARKRHDAPPNAAHHPYDATHRPYRALRTGLSGRGALDPSQCTSSYRFGERYASPLHVHRTAAGVTGPVEPRYEFVSARAAGWSESKTPTKAYHAGKWHPAPFAAAPRGTNSYLGPRRRDRCWAAPHEAKQRALARCTLARPVVTFNWKGRGRGEDDRARSSAPRSIALRRERRV